MGARTGQTQAETVGRRLVGWMERFATTPPSLAVETRLRSILTDTLACALAGGADRTSERALRVVRKLGGHGDCTIVGTGLRANAPLASFANGVLIRTLDFNDTSFGQRIGHPSDNIAGLFAAAELADRSGADLLQAIRLCYEIYCRIADLDDSDGPWDHVTFSGVAVAAAIGWLMRLPAEQTMHAVAIAAMHCGTLGQIRMGHISSAKSVANALVVENAWMAVLLAAEGVTGPDLAIEGKRGLTNVILQGADPERLFAAAKTDAVMGISQKAFPCFVLAQAPIAAAIDLRALTEAAGQIERLELRVPDTDIARLRLGGGHDLVPATREAADHSIHFLVALGLLDGEVALRQFQEERWKDPAVAGIIRRMDFQIDAAMKDNGAFPCRMQALMADGRAIGVERAAAPGSALSPLSAEELRRKFLGCAVPALGEGGAERILAMLAEPALPSARALMAALVPNPRREH